MKVFRKDASRMLTTGLAAGLCLSVVAGCNTSGSGPTSGSVRTSGETAPTDLQLLCASQAQQELEIAGNVLPVSSMPAGDDAYQVNLTYDGGQAVCNIDSEGNIESISKV